VTNPQLLKTTLYAVSENKSGIQPMDLRVLVRPDKVEDKIGSIFIPDSKKESDQFAQCKATIVAVGENAWEEAASRSAAFRKPMPGDRVLISKYGGITVTGSDGEDYRLLNDEDVTARLEE